MLRSFTAAAFLVALSACTPLIPITKAEMTPVYSGQAPENLNIAVVDHKSFILSGDKEEWFEGIARGVYYIPFSAKRPGPKSTQPFALYLSSMLAEAMVAAGSNVTIVPIAKGTDIGEAVRQSSEPVQKVVESGESLVIPYVLVLWKGARYVDIGNARPI